MRRLLSWIIAAGVVLFITTSATTVDALQACNALPISDESAHVLFGRPVWLLNEVPEEKELINRELFEMSNNGQSKFADWIGYFLDGSTLGAADTPNYSNDLCLRADRTLEADPASQDDYNNAGDAGYERVQLLPGNAVANAINSADANLYSTIVPLRRELVPAWNEYNRLIQEFVRGGNPSYVLAGTEYRIPMPALPAADEDHKVPSAIWIVVYRLANEARSDSLTYRALYLRQSDCISSDQTLIDRCELVRNNWRQGSINIAQLQGFTDLDFFTELSNGTEAQLERLPGVLQLE